MRLIVALLLILILVACHSPTTHAPTTGKAITASANRESVLSSFSKDKFLSWSSEKEAEFISKLRPEQKAIFLKSFLTGSNFIVGQTYLTFLGNGEFIYDHSLPAGGFAGGEGPAEDRYKYFIGHWRLEGQHVVLWENGTNKKDAFIRGKVTWIDFKGLVDPDKPGDFAMEFQLADEGGSETLLYMPKTESAAIKHYRKINNL